MKEQKLLQPCNRKGNHCLCLTQRYFEYDPHPQRRLRVSGTLTLQATVCTVKSSLRRLQGRGVLNHSSADFYFYFLLKTCHLSPCSSPLVGLKICVCYNPLQTAGQSFLLPAENWSLSRLLFIKKKKLNFQYILASSM